MSIKVGLINDNYDLDYLTKQNNALILNSFIDSNIILINPNNTQLQDMFINYQNKFITGLSTNTYVFQTENNNIMTMTNSNISLFKSTSINDNVYIKDILHTSNTGVYINSNVNIMFKTPSDSFAVSDIFRINSNYTVEYDIKNLSIKNGPKSMMVLYDSNINMSNDVFIYNGTMYVNKISGLQGRPLNIENATYNSTTIDKLTASRNFTVSSDTFDDTALNIFKKTGNADIISVNSCNVNKTIITNHMTMNKLGQLGLGTTLPQANIHLKSPLSSNVLYYEGKSYGDAFKLNNRGNIGIGTDAPDAQLHIIRYDDLDNNEFRKTPIMKMDMNFDRTKNISNLYSSFNTNLNEINLSIYPLTTITSNTTPTLNVNIDNKFYLLNPDIYEKTGFNIHNISNIILPFPSTLSLPIESQTQPISSVAILNVVNNVIYPASDIISVEVENVIRPTQNPNYIGAYDLLMMSRTTKNNGGFINDTNNPKYNASNFTNYNGAGTINKLNEQTVYSIRGLEVKYSLNFIIEKNLIISGNSRIVSYPFNYTKITPVQLDAPNFWNISYNNDFVSSLSPLGTLSLGKQIPKLQDGNFLLYAPGNAFMNSLNVSNINTSQVDGNISFNNKNITNINKISCQRLETTDISLNNIVVNQLTASYANIPEGNYSNLITSNITFFTVNNSYMSISYANAHINTRCSIGNSRELNNNNCLKITVDNQIVPVSHNVVGGSFYTRHSGISIYNSTNVNPCLSIQATSPGTTPYLHLNNNGSGYYFRIAKSATTTNFQIMTDDINNTNTIRRNDFINNNFEPHIFQHIKEYNVITLGEQDVICIDSLFKDTSSISNPNSANKVSIGIPYGELSGSYSSTTHPKYFNDVINKSDNNYMLNIFGNVKMADVNKNPIFTAIKHTDNKVYTGINQEPDYIHTLNVNGTIKAADIKFEIDGVLISLSNFLANNRQLWPQS